MRVLIIYCQYNTSIVYCMYMKSRIIFQLLAKFNKIILPSFTKKHLDLKKANKFQMLIIGYRYYVTKNAL